MKQRHWAVVFPWIVFHIIQLLRRSYLPAVRQNYKEKEHVPHQGGNSLIVRDPSLIEYYFLHHFAEFILCAEFFRISMKQLANNLLTGMLGLLVLEFCPWTEIWRKPKNLIHEDLFVYHIMWNLWSFDNIFEWKDMCQIIQESQADWSRYSLLNIFRCLILIN